MNPILAKIALNWENGTRRILPQTLASIRFNNLWSDRGGFERSLMLSALVMSRDIEERMHRDIVHIGGSSDFSGEPLRPRVTQN